MTAWGTRSGPVSPSAGNPNYILSHDLADDAIHWLHSQEAAAPDRPYFLYFAPGGTHATTFHYAIADGGATSPGDYAATSGDGSIPPGNTTATIHVPIAADTVDEADDESKWSNS